MASERHSAVFLANAIFGIISSIVAIVTLPILLLGGLAAYFDIRQQVVRPELEMKFVYTQTEQASFHIENNSDVVAEEPSYYFSIYDYDFDKESINSKESTRRSAPYISGNSRSFLAPILPSGSTGEKYIVWAQVSCKNCTRSKKYLLYIDRQNTIESFSRLLEGDLLNMDLPTIIKTTRVEERTRFTQL